MFSILLKTTILTKNIHLENACLLFGLKEDKIFLFLIFGAFNEEVMYKFIALGPSSVVLFRYIGYPRNINLDVGANSPGDQIVACSSVNKNFSVSFMITIYYELIFLMEFNVNL